MTFRICVDLPVALIRANIPVDLWLVNVRPFQNALGAAIFQRDIHGGNLSF
jgi:hypothetical protein